MANDAAVNRIWMGVFLMSEETRLLGEVDQARRLADLTFCGRRAMQEFVEDLELHSVGLQDLRVDHLEAPWHLKLGFMELFREHMAIFSNYPHCPPLYELNLAVHSMTRRIN